MTLTCRYMEIEIGFKSLQWISLIKRFIARFVTCDGAFVVSTMVLSLDGSCFVLIAVMSLNLFQ